MGRKWAKIVTVVELSVVFIHLFIFHALTNQVLYFQYPHTKFSIIKAVSPALPPKGERPTGQQHLPTCAPLLGPWLGARDGAPRALSSQL